VVDVSVGDQDLGDLQSVALQDVENAGDVRAGIDDDGFVRQFIANDGAIALQRADREDFVDHRKAAIGF